MSIRTVPFKSVLDGVLRRLGLDSDAENLPHDTVRAVTEHINTRIDTAWNFWPWKELEQTEERAFRPSWNVALAYVAGDEVFYEVDRIYYRALSAAAAGTVPAASAIFEVMDIPLYGNIPFLQTGAQPIGQVFGVYNADPCSNQASVRNLGFNQTSEGVNVGLGGGLPAVWITFRLPVPEFTSVPTATGRTYQVGDVAYEPDSGECYVVRTRTEGAGPGDPATLTWARVLFPQMFAAYVKLGAYSDALLEMDDSDSSASSQNVQMRLAKANRTAAVADEMLAALCNRQIEQGDHARYRRFGRLADRCGCGWPMLPQQGSVTPGSLLTTDEEQTITTEEGAPLQPVI